MEHGLSPDGPMSSTEHREQVTADRFTEAYPLGPICVLSATLESPGVNVARE